ncbi:DUF1905 domain-containing protein [Ilyomonas limi]|uniref:DUF1905 domain-containing protein n=1 Tax=Ilyomonas limi TaxID=2575867 RepID=A0A4U3KYP1_9BACT|nr:YdeI/OmpD-associated family protein [Ilyomonas limi]TKK67748.1 DUF1905 domain-containing protein [Ilyomonas limi]
MIHFTATIKKFGIQGEKTGWSYIEIPAAIAQQLKPDCRQSFRVKGKMDDYHFTQTSLLPMGEGNFIIPLNATIRKNIRKGIGATLAISIDEDTSPFEYNADFMECLQDEPAAIAYFKSLPGSHQKYFSKWIDSAKTAPTKAKRIAQAVTALAHRQGYAQMIRSLKGQKEL